ncbi:hypothetical protein [Rhodoblastus sp.]|uniref:hypothetical protein n=1 Tax=Rhodoblastus sp. TaxID=1962975 RepID=UPI003F9A86D2
MFLLRCLFWLGLAFFQIAEREGVDPSSAFNAAAASQTATLGQMAAQAATGHCQAHLGQCAALAARAARFKQIAAAPSRDTLTGRDRTPAWRD